MIQPSDDAGDAEDAALQRYMPLWLFACVGCPLIGYLVGSDLLYQRNYLALLAAYVLLAGVAPLAAGLFFFARAWTAHKRALAPWILAVCVAPAVLAVSPLLQLIEGPVVKEATVLAVNLVGSMERYGDAVNSGGIFKAILDDGTREQTYKYDSTVAAIKTGDVIRATVLERRNILLHIEAIKPASARPLVYRGGFEIGLATFSAVALVAVLPGSALWLRARRADRTGRGNPYKYRALGVLLLLIGMAILSQLAPLVS
jgi:hypothetical protein